MTSLGDLGDLDLTTIDLEDGTPLLASWDPSAGTDGLWIGRESLPASAVTVELDLQPSRMTPDGLYPSKASVQDVIRSFQRDGFNAARVITDDDTGGPARARSFLLTDYRRLQGPTEVGSNGILSGISYGRPGEPAGGYANAQVIVAEIRGSEDPTNEIGGCIASLQMGRGDDPAPTGSLWGTCYTLRGPVDRQPGGLMAFTAVVQNFFDGSGSRTPNYGYAAVTRPGIGDGADFHEHDPIRFATTHPVDIGFVVCGDSGAYPDGGGIGYRVAFQAGGGASPWAGPDQDWRTRIGTGLVVRDWLEGGIHVQPPHAEAGPVPHLRLDRREGQDGNLLECRTEDGEGVVAAIRPDGRIALREGRRPDEAVTKAQLDEAHQAVVRRNEELESRIQALEAALGSGPAAPTVAGGGSGTAPPPTRLVDLPLSHLVGRAAPWRPAFWRSVARRARR